MPVIADTAYPRLPGNPGPAELEAFTPEPAELAFARQRTRQPGPRLALLVLLKTFQHLGRITRLALLDIVPTVEVWRAIERGSETSPHWPQLARSEPEPEQEIGGDPNRYFEGLIGTWTRSRTLDAFRPEALAHYRAAWGDPGRIHAFCEDYRAGATLDRAADEADEAANKTVDCPVHILASTDYLQSNLDRPALDVWRSGFAPSATGQVLASGHFLAEEQPTQTLSALTDFL